MMTLWPRCLDIASAMIREETSEAPPAANGTISVMLRSGQVWANADAAARPVAIEGRRQDCSGARET